MKHDYAALITAVDGFRGRRLCVVGDLMLDRYVIGDVERISPEAPVPVLHVRREEFRPGGAANVAANITALGGQAVLIGLVGKDESAQTLETLCHNKGIEPCFAISNRPTIEKARFMSQGQQLLRADREDPGPASANDEATLIAHITHAATDCDVFLLSDYAKGVCTKAVADALRACGRPVIVDPKPANRHLYTGMFLLTPNHREAAAMAATCAKEHPPHAALLTLQKEGTTHVLITCGAKGMALRTEAGKEYFLPSKARTVFDVTGAGDTVLATLGLGVAEGLPLPDAANLANHAAGIVVGKVGTDVVSPEELKEDLKACLESGHDALQS